jgi:hypothetical protein
MFPSNSMPSVPVCGMVHERSMPRDLAGHVIHCVARLLDAGVVMLWRTVVLERTDQRPTYHAVSYGSSPRSAGHDVVTCEVMFAYLPKSKSALGFHRSCPITMQSRQYVSDELRSTYCASSSQSHCGHWHFIRSRPLPLVPLHGPSSPGKSRVSIRRPLSRCAESG